MLFSDIFHLLRFVWIAKLETKYFGQKLCKLTVRFLTSLCHLDISFLLLLIVVDWRMLLCSFNPVKSSHIFSFIVLVKDYKTGLFNHVFFGVLSNNFIYDWVWINVFSTFSLDLRLGDVSSILQTGSLHSL